MATIIHVMVGTAAIVSGICAGAVLFRVLGVPLTGGQYLSLVLSGMVGIAGWRAWTYHQASQTIAEILPDAAQRIAAFQALVGQDMRDILADHPTWPFIPEPLGIYLDIKEGSITPYNASQGRFEITPMLIGSEFAPIAARIQSSLAPLTPEQREAWKTFLARHFEWTCGAPLSAHDRLSAQAQLTSPVVSPSRVGKFDFPKAEKKDRPEETI